MNTYQESYLSVRMLDGKKRKKLTQQERELEAERYLHMKISFWLDRTNTIISEERFNQWIQA